MCPNADGRAPKQGVAKETGTPSDTPLDRINREELKERIDRLQDRLDETIGGFEAPPEAVAGETEQPAASPPKSPENKAKNPR